VALSGIIPGDDFDKVGLQLQGLAYALGQIDLPYTIPVLTTAEKLELER
jgi:hypothetical protein